MGKRYAVKSATLTFGVKTFDMETGVVNRPQTRDAVDVTALADKRKRFIKGALLEDDALTLPVYLDGVNDITVDDAPAALAINATMENGIDADVTVEVSYSRCIVTKVEPSKIQAASDRKALYDVTFQPDGSDDDASSSSSSSSAT